MKKAYTFSSKLFPKQYPKDFWVVVLYGSLGGQEVLGLFPTKPLAELFIKSLPEEYQLASLPEDSNRWHPIAAEIVYYLEN